MVCFQHSIARTNSLCYTLLRFLWELHVGVGLLTSGKAFPLFLLIGSPLRASIHSEGVALRKNKTEELVIGLAGPVAAGLELELVDIEFVREGERWFLRVYIDKPGGVKIEDCERMSRALDKVLDDADPIQRAYSLEVSSPGIERPLVRRDDFIRFSGSKVLVKTSCAIDGCKRFEGVLVGVDDDDVLLNVEQDRQVRIPMEAVSRANLVFEW